MAERYPEKIHGAIAAGLSESLGNAIEVRTATQNQPKHGLTTDVLDSTDVLTQWNHTTHARIDDKIIKRMHQRILGGMSLLMLHSGHFSKIFKRLINTTYSLAQRNNDKIELIWTMAPTHPIAHDVPQPILIDQQKMYKKFFDIPAPDELIFISTFAGGEVFRSGCCWRRGKNKVFYFSPSDQKYPVYHHPDIRRILANAIEWAHPNAEPDFAPPGIINEPAPQLTNRMLTAGAAS